MSESIEGRLARIEERVDAIADAIIEDAYVDEEVVEDQFPDRAAYEPHQPFVDAMREFSRAAQYDPVSHPEHYNAHPSGVECVEMTKLMNFNLGNAFKYLHRRLLKGDPVENMRKAEFYLNAELGLRRSMRSVAARLSRRLVSRESAWGRAGNAVIRRPEWEPYRKYLATEVNTIRGCVEDDDPIAEELAAVSDAKECIVIASGMPFDVRAVETALGYVRDAIGETESRLSDDDDEGYMVDCGC